MTRHRRQEERPKASGVVLDGQVVDNDARSRLCPVSQYVVVAGHQFLPNVRQTQARWASQLRWLQPPSLPLRIGWRLHRWGHFVVAVASVNVGDVGGRRITMVV